jgi:hypothetical protein
MLKIIRPKETRGIAVVTGFKLNKLGLFGKYKT